MVKVDLKKLEEEENSIVKEICHKVTVFIACRQCDCIIGPKKAFTRVSRRHWKIRECDLDFFSNFEYDNDETNITCECRNEIGVVEPINGIRYVKVLVKNVRISYLD